MASGLRTAAFLLLLLLPVGGLSASRQSDYLHQVARIRAEGFERSQVRDFAWHLTDVIGPRPSGSENMRQAQQWAKATMDRIGLANTAIEPWGEHGVNWDIERLSMHLLTPDYQPLIGFPHGYTVGTDGVVEGGVTIVRIAGREDLEKYRGTLQGAIVLATPPRELAPRFQPDAIRHDEASLAAFVEEATDRNIAERRREPWMQNPPAPEDLEQAEINEFFKTEGVRLVLTAARGGDGTVFLTGRRGRTMEDVGKTVPTVALAAEHYGRLYRLAERGMEPTVEIEARIRFEERDKQEYNVVGEIAGSDLADEIVMLGAHLDSWHTGTGATDNAAGSACVLEAMRILKAIGAAPRRTIRAALWSNEEGGLRGSRAYVAHHFGNPRDGLQPDYEKFSVYFNMDNGTGRIRGVHQQGNRFVAPLFEEWMKPFADLKVDTLSNFSNRGSDQLAFDEAGLPGFQFVQDRIEYRTRTHHTNMDVFDKLLADDLQRNAVIMAAFAYRAAMEDEKIPRKPFENWRPEFEITDNEAFTEGRALTNAVADFDNDGDLDFFVGFAGTPNRLYRNDEGGFADVAEAAGVAETGATRASAWGDYNGDGHLDLFVGFASRDASSARLYENDGSGRFTDVASRQGVTATGAFRQASWVDFDNDGDVDLFVAFRDRPNVLYRNEDGQLGDVAAALGVADPRRTVGASWFDFDTDGDLDLLVANMDGDANGLFRNDGGRFVDVAEDAGLADGGRALGFSDYGSVRPALADFDNDGDFDVFFANYGPNALFENRGDGTFVNVAPRLGLAVDSRYDTAAWGDYDNNGAEDLYVNGTLSRGTAYRDYLFHNDAVRFPDITPAVLEEQNSDHGAQWADMDGDGDLDLLLTGAIHHLVVNSQDEERAPRSLQVMVVDEQGRYTKAGSEVRLFDAASGRLLGSRLVDTGSGYNTQNAAPVHFGLARMAPVHVEVTTLTARGRRSSRIENVDPATVTGQWLVVRVGADGTIGP